MEEECDDDPFDDPFGDALHVSSGLQATRDSSAVDDESVGGENAVKGVVARVDVRVRGEFLRYKNAREVAVYITISKPPPGPFDLSAVTEDTGWPRSKVARYGWIEKSRVEDFVNGLWDQDGRRFCRYRHRSYKNSTLWSVETVYCCECGPEDYTLTVSQVTAMNVKRATTRVVGTSKKCGCKKQYVFSELNSGAIRIVSLQTISVRDLVRVSWDPAESHAAACARSQSVATINNIRENVRGTKWRYHENETKSLFRLIHHLQHEIISRYCDKVCQAETSLAPARVRKAMFHVLDEAKTIDESTEIKKERTDDSNDAELAVSYIINYSGEVHNVSGLETLEDCALDRDHTQVKCSCALGRNGQLCPPKSKAMLIENELWTFKELNIQCKPDDVQTTEIDVDAPMIQDDVEAFQPTHRRSLGAAFDRASSKSRWKRMAGEAKASKLALGTTSRSYCRYY